MTSNSPAPLLLDEVLDPAWLQRTLAPTGLIDGPVEDVTITETLKTSATKVRFAIHSNGRQIALCVKGFFDAPLREVAAAISQSEVRFYQEIAPSTDLRLPDCVYSAVDPETGHGLLIMRDMVAQGGRFLNVLYPYSPKQGEGSLGQLAIIHAASWGEEKVRKHEFLRSRVEWLLENPLISLEDLQALLDGERGEPLPASVRDAKRLVRGVEVISGRIRSQTPCVIHGDAHPGNILEIDGKQGLVDWQLVQRGNWSLDVSYHIIASLSVEDRRAQERPLLEHYLGALAATGAEAPSFEQAWEQYRAHLVYGYYLWALTRGVAAPITHELVRRLGLAAADHDSFRLLGC